MLVIGILLLVVGLGGGVLLAYLAASSGQTVTLAAGAVSVGMSPVTLVVAGAVSVAVAWLGVRLGAAGARRQHKQRRELKEQRRQGKVLRTPTGTGGAAPTGTGGSTSGGAPGTGGAADPTGPGGGTPPPRP